MPKAYPFNAKLIKGGDGVQNALINDKCQKIIQFIKSKVKTSVTNIYKQSQITQLETFVQLRILRDAGFVKKEKSGQKVFYTLSYKRFEKVERIAKLLI